MTVKTPENPPSCGSQNGKAKSAKSRFVARIARLVRQAGLSYADWWYVVSRRDRLRQAHRGEAAADIEHHLHLVIGDGFAQRVVDIELMPVAFVGENERHPQLAARFDLLYRFHAEGAQGRLAVHGEVNGMGRMQTSAQQRRDESDDGFAHDRGLSHFWGTSTGFPR
jgi:hypothetical protein